MWIRGKVSGNTNSDNFWAASGNCDGTGSRSVVAGRDNYDEPKIPEGFYGVQKIKKKFLMKWKDPVVYLRKC